jgi:hypothetical protein
MRAGHSQAGCAFVFMSWTKVTSRAGDALGERDRRIVAGLHDHAEYQVSTGTGLPSSMKVREPSDRQAFSLTRTGSSSFSFPAASSRTRCTPSSAW